MFVDQFLSELDQLLGEVELEGADELTAVLEQLIPELEDLCASLWLLELVVTICKRREK